MKKKEEKQKEQKRKMKERRAHKVCKLNQWREEDMCRALEMFSTDPNQSMRAFALSFNIPVSIFQKRAENMISRHNHKSRG